MATQKELEATLQLVRVATEVNASSNRVNVEVCISSSSVGFNITDPVEVLAKCKMPDEWEWIHYGGNDAAYFSGDIFTEDAFLKRCQEHIDIIKGFKGRTVVEVAQ